MRPAALRASPPPPVARVCEGRRSFSVGDASNLFAVEFVTPDDPWAAHARQIAAPGGLVAVALRVSDLDRIVCELKAKGIDPVSLPDHGGRRAAWLPLHDRAGTDLVLVQHSLSTQERHAAAV